MTPNPMRDLYVMDLLNRRHPAPAVRPSAHAMPASGTQTMKQIALYLAATIGAISILLAIVM